MITITDLKDRLDQYDDDVMVVFRAATERELAVADDVDYWGPDRLRMKALVWKDA